MQIKNPKFELSVMNKSQYPQNNMPEIVLAGKSNVGKSSFINTITNRKSLARTSSTPGKTRQLNFYNIDDTFYFVDLPGYGYSQMSKNEQIKVGEAIEDYIQNRKNIALIILLIDIRHSPSENDIDMLNFIKHTGYNFFILASKADKIAKTKVGDYAKKLAKELEISEETVISFSAESKLNIETIIKKISSSL